MSNNRGETCSDFMINAANTNPSTFARPILACMDTLA